MSAYEIPVITIVWIHQDPTAAIAILDGSIEKIGNIVKVDLKNPLSNFFHQHYSVVVVGVSS